MYVCSGKKKYFSKSSYCLKFNNQIYQTVFERFADNINKVKSLLLLKYIYIYIYSLMTNKRLKINFQKYFIIIYDRLYLKNFVLHTYTFSAYG